LLHDKLRCANEITTGVFMQLLLITVLISALAAYSADSPASEPKEVPFVTEAEGSACMGDDKSRKQTEEAARNEARRRAAEQSATQVRSQSRVSIGTLEEDVIRIMSTGKVRVAEVLESKWDKDGCYTYRIRAEVTQARPSELAGTVQNEETRFWIGLEDKPDLRAVDDFIDRFPSGTHLNRAIELQAELEAGYPRIAGPFLVMRNSTLRLRPADNAIGISEIAPGELLSVFKVHDAEWAMVKRDVGHVFTRFDNLRPITEAEAGVWLKCQKTAKDIRVWQGFLQQYPDSHLARLARQRISHLESRLTREEGLSSRDSEEIALWNRCIKTRDVQCAREYRRRYPNGKFEKESWLIQ
jgi:hypothetical protein